MSSDKRKDEESIDQWREDEESGASPARFTSYNGVEVLKSIDAMSWGRGEHGRLHRTLKSRDTRGKAIQCASVHNNFPTCSNWSLKRLPEHIDPALHADTFPPSIGQVPVVPLYLVTIQPGSTTDRSGTKAGCQLLDSKILDFSEERLLPTFRFVFR